MTRKGGPTICLLMSLSLCHCGEEPATPIIPPLLVETGADMVQVDIEHVITVRGVNKGEVWADTAFFFRDSSIVEFRNPILVFFDPNGGRVWSDSVTVMYEEGKVTEGLGFTSDVEFTQLTVGPGSIRNVGSTGGQR